MKSIAIFLLAVFSPALLSARQTPPPTTSRPISVTFGYHAGAKTGGYNDLATSWFSQQLSANFCMPKIGSARILGVDFFLSSQIGCFRVNKEQSGHKSHKSFVYLAPATPYIDLYEYRGWSIKYFIPHLAVCNNELGPALGGTFVAYGTDVRVKYENVGLQAGVFTLQGQTWISAAFVFGMPDTKWWKNQ